jgi:membrane peptidoglycan carboxypeptidase
VSLAKTMGVGDVPSVPSLALGSGDVTLLSMTAAYGAFANHGLLPEPRLIRRVETQAGELLYENAASPHRVIRESTAFMMTTMLADVVNSGTAWPARRVGFTLPAAGKTGTTNDYHDAWFIGFTPRLVSGVWIGYDQPRTIVAGGYAGELAVPLWGRFMMQATKGHAPDWYGAPDSVVTATICPLSGKLATQQCAGDTAVHPYVDYFASDHAPTEYCDRHVLHGGRGFFGSLVAAVRGHSTQDSPVQAAVATEAATPAPSPATARATRTEAEPEKKKRGFWGRVFGRPSSPAR